MGIRVTFLLFLGSSAVERSAVNRLVAGSNPARGVPIHKRYRVIRPHQGLFYWHDCKITKTIRPHTSIIGRPFCVKCVFLCVLALCKNVFFYVGSRYTKMPDFYLTKRATKGYVTGWGNWLYDSPALRSRHRYDTYYESWVRSR